MASVTRLEHLLKLLDDDSEVVRSAVREKLACMRKDLPLHLAHLERPLSVTEDRMVAQMLAPVRREELLEQWMRWRWMDQPDAQLEEGLSQIGAFLAGWKADPADLSPRLDALADEAFKDRGHMNERELAEWLFGRQGDPVRFRGNSKDYYAPQNSNLYWVLDTGLGNPISLCCLYRLIARRFELKVSGCNFPGHFLSRVVFEGETYLVDCFNRGRFMLASDVARHHPAANPSMDEIIREPATVDAILLRVLRNLEEAYDRGNAAEERKLMRKLALRLMED
ncbi:MAG: transglutaminase family protein [Verrucomicrobiales bacterium]|nr:transglutaminase family protein [Verrucomicrobiales bacterium]